MGTTEYIKNFSNQILGMIETDSEGNQTARLWPGRQIVGYYKIKTNVTTDFYGRIIGKGNVVASLIYNNKQ